MKANAGSSIKGLPSLTAVVSTTVAGASEAWSVNDTSQMAVGQSLVGKGELVLVTAINSATSVQVTRGYSSTVAVAHAVGDPLTPVWVTVAVQNSAPPQTNVGWIDTT